MKITTAQDAVSQVQDGMSIMIGGFLTVGTPETLVDAIVEKKVKDLTIIANDGGLPEKGIGKLIAAGLVKKLITTHIGMNPLVGQMMNEGTLEVELVPQGTLAERIRSGGAGLGGVLTPTGLGTEVGNGKQTVEVDGKTYLLEKPLLADVALIRGSIVDEDGNIFYKGTTRNFNQVMATAAKLVLVGAEEIVKPGDIQAETIITPGIFVDYIVGGEK